MDQFERVLQSNEQLLSDDAVEIDAAVAMNRQGGGRRRKLTDLAVDQVIQKKKTNLFCPINLSNQLCFSICLCNAVRIYGKKEAGTGEHLNTFNQINKHNRNAAAPHGRLPHTKHK